MAESVGGTAGSAAAVPAVHTRQVLAGTTAVVFDCDGVLWQGDTPIEGAAASVQRLVKHEKQVFYCTNNSTKSRAQYVEKLRRLGFPANKEQVFCVSHAAAAITKAKLAQLEPAKPPKAFVIGQDALADELEDAGVCTVRSSSLSADPVGSPAAFDAIRTDPDICAVVVGLSLSFNYRMLCYATLCLHANPDCLFIATNPDAATVTAGRLQPGAGSVVAAVAYASGRTPTFVGKPQPYMMDLILAQAGVAPRETLMVGDRLDTDVAFGARAGTQTTLVLSGVTAASEVDERMTAEGVIPDCIVPSVARIFPA